MPSPALRGAAAVCPEEVLLPGAPTVLDGGELLTVPVVSDEGERCSEGNDSDRACNSMQSPHSLSQSLSRGLSHSVSDLRCADQEAFEDLVLRLEAVYLRDLGQLPVLLEENRLLRNSLQVGGHGQILKKSHAENAPVDGEGRNQVEVLTTQDIDAAKFDEALKGDPPAMLDKLRRHSRAAARASSIVTTLARNNMRLAMDAEDSQRFHLKEEWKWKNESRKSMMPLSPIARQKSRHVGSMSSDLDVEAEEEVETYKGHCSRLIGIPGHPYRMIWDFVGAAFIFYDLFTIPLQLFNIEDQPYVSFSSVMDWVTLLFWTFNVGASLTVGYTEAGVIVMDPVRILRNYLKGWFWVDLIVVVPDWIFTIAAMDGGSKSGAGDSVKLLRILRLVRMVRLLRLMKLRKIMQDVNDRIDSEYASIVASIIKMIMLLLAINHFIACAWYGIADALDSTSNTWIKAHGYVEEEWYYLYATAFHWSITQFTPSSMQVQPQNMSERTFALLIIVLALVGFSYLVGGIIAHIGQLRSMSEDTAKEFWNLRRYLRQNSVPVELSIRIQRYLEHAWQRKQSTLQTGDIKVFALISDQLLGELQCALALPHLFIHPLFERLETVSFVTNQRLAKTAIEHQLLAVDDNLFLPGENANYMYVVAKGKLQYFRTDTTGIEHTEWVDKGEDWIAEPVMWTTAWVHLGLLVAYKESDLLTVDAKRCLDCIKLNPQARGFIAQYARSFLLWLNAEHRDHLSDIYQGELISPLVLEFMDGTFSTTATGTTGTDAPPAHMLSTNTANGEAGIEGSKETRSSRRYAWEVSSNKESQHMVTELK